MARLLPSTRSRALLSSTVALVGLFVAGCVPATPPTDTTTTAPPTTTTTTAPTTTAPPTTTTTTAPPTCADTKNPWANLVGCGWPGAGNTGPSATACPGGLTVKSGSPTGVVAVTVDGTVIACQDITGSLDIRAKGVIIRNSKVRYDGGGVNGSGVIKVEDGASATVDHVETDGLNHTHSCVWHQGTSVSIVGLNCHGVNDGAFAWADLGFSSTSGDNFSLTDSWIHDLTINAANGHEDGFQTEGAANGVIRHNTFQLTTVANSAIAIWNGLKSSANITVDTNLISGGGFAIYAEDYNPTEAAPTGGFTVTSVSFTNNRFSTRVAGCVGQWGVWFTRPSLLPYNGGPTDGWHRSGNTVLETGESLDSGNPHVNGLLCT